MDFGDDDEFDLAPIVAHNANFSIPLMDSPSPGVSLSPPSLPQVQQRPISKRRGKKRSSRACSSCRARKVRCNIVAHGAPCSNCKHDEVDCILPLSRRQKAAKERAEQEQRLEQGKGGSDDASCCTTGNVNAKHDGERFSHGHYERKTPQLSPPHGMGMSEHALCEILPAHSASQRGSPVLQPTRFPSLISKTEVKTGRKDIEAPLATAPLMSLSKLPRVFASLPSHLTSTDISYLAARSAFTLPSEALQVALLHAYVEFVHPSLPLIDLYDLLDSVKSGKGRKITLLLFQAIMLAAAEYVSERVLRSEYPNKSKSDVLVAMAERVKLLYDFDTTIDRLTIIQSMILLSHSLASRNSRLTHKTSHHYLGLALSLSFSLGLHRNPGVPELDLRGTCPATPSTLQVSAIRQKRLERRTWWCLYLEDKLQEIAGHGKSRLNDVDFDTTCLEPGDFDFHRESGSEEEEQHCLRDKAHAQSIIEKVKLCQWRFEVPSKPRNTGGTRDSPQAHALDASQISRFQSCSLSAQLTRSQNLPNNHQQQAEVTAPRLGSNSARSYSYAISNSASSASEDVEMEQEIECLTPQNEMFTDESDFTLDPTVTQKDHDIAGREEVVIVGRDSHGAGKMAFGVDREFDDYLEFLGV